MEHVHRLAGLADSSDAVWPGFDLRDHILIVAVGPNGPVFIVGDSTPPPEFTWLDPKLRIGIREGTPARELLGLQVAMTWQGIPRAATSFSVSDALSSSLFSSILVHEAFHTHQHRVRAAFPDHYITRGNACFPDSTVRALALLNLEGHYLADALRTANEEQLRASARAAVAIRQLRCQELGPAECAKQRSMEQIEGTASYVEAALTGQLARYGRAWKDSLLVALSPVESKESLSRAHYYGSGHAWLLLLEHFGVEHWKERVALSSPDALLADQLNLRDPTAWASVAERALQGTAWEHAALQADEVMRRWKGPAAKLRFWIRPRNERDFLRSGCMNSPSPGRGPTSALKRRGSLAHFRVAAEFSATLPAR